MNNRKVIPLKNRTIAAPAAQKHSKRLEMALRNFITSMGGQYYDDELAQGILSSYFQLNCGVSIEQKVHIRQTDYICYTTPALRLPTENSGGILQCIQLANRINNELDYGSFAVDPKAGSIRFRTYYEPVNAVNMESLDKLLGYPMYVIGKYIDVFRDISYNETTPK